MKIIPFIFLILGSMLEIFDVLLFKFVNDFPDFVSITSNSIQIFLFFLAIIFSIINIFSKQQEKTIYFFITGLSLVLFIARIGWLIS